MRRVQTHLTALATRPPRWLRHAYVPAFCACVLAVAERRGAVVGLVAALVYAGLGVAGLAAHRTVRWAREHPLADGAFLGPLVFLGLAGVTALPLSWCLAGGGLGLVLGASGGMRRRRQSRDATGVR